MTKRGGTRQVAKPSPVDGALRPIVPVSLAAGPATPAVVPAKALGAKPELRWVAPRLLHVEEAYQRDLAKRSLALIRRIVAHWDWAHVKPIICAKDADGRLVVIDGQHTAIAAVSHGGIAALPVVVVDKPRIEGRAAAFLAHNRDRVFLTPMAIHHAALAAGDAAALRLDAVVKKAGARIVKAQKAAWDVGDTVSLGAIKLAVTQYGAGGAALALKLLVAAGRAPLVEGEIKAAAALLHGAGQKPASRRSASGASPQAAALAAAARPVPYAALLAAVKSETRETWQRLAIGIAAERKQRVWQALAGLWRAQLAGQDVEQRDGEAGRQQIARAGGARPNGAHGPILPASPPPCALPAPRPPRPAPAAAPPARLPKVEAAVLAALARAPDEGLGLAVLAATTEYPGAAVQTALKALNADRSIHCPRPGMFALARITA